MAKLRSKDLTLARSSKLLSSTLKKRHNAEYLITHATSELKKLGYRLRLKKGPSGWKSKRMTTALRKTIWLGVGWASRPAVDRAATLMHELVHARQYRYYTAFLARYIADSRFRFAMEAQAYRETIRAYRSMRYSETALKKHARDLPRRFIKSYWILGRRMKKAVIRYMGAIVLKP